MSGPLTYSFRLVHSSAVSECEDRNARTQERGGKGKGGEEDVFLSAACFNCVACPASFSGPRKFRCSGCRMRKGPGALLTSSGIGPGKQNDLFARSLCESNQMSERYKELTSDREQTSAPSSLLFSSSQGDGLSTRPGCHCYCPSTRSPASTLLDWTGLP